MGKKNKKKFRAQLSQAFQNLEKSEVQKTKTPENLVAASEKQKNVIIKDDIDADDTYIKHDIQKIAMGLGACLIVLLAVWHLNKSTPIIQNLSESLSQILHIGK